MMNRRSFLAREAPAAALAASATLNAQSSSAAGQANIPSIPSVFEVVTTRLHFVQLERYLGWLEKRALPLLQKHLGGTQGFFTIDVGPHVPAVVSIRPFVMLTDLMGSRANLEADPEWAAARAELESTGPAFFRQDWTLLAKTPFSPALNPSAPGDPTHKVYEFRTYEASTYRQMGLMHDRFAGGEIDIFHKVGIHPILYADTLYGPNKPNMNYLIPFEDLAHREQAWASFRASPEWKSLSEEYMRRSGELARNISSMILTPTKFSMLR